MTTETPFSQSATPEQGENKTPVTPTITLPQEVAEFVGSGKKYATVEDALKSVPHAQNHISKLELDLANTRAELEKRKSTEELLNEIKAANTSQTTTTVPVGVSTEQVSQLVTKTIEEREIKIIEGQNISKVTSKFKEKFGDKAEEVYIKLANDTGMSIAVLNNLSKTSPSAVFKLAGIDSVENKTQQVSKPNSSVNTEALNNQTQNTQNLTSRVKSGASTKDLTAAWKIAGQKVGRPAE